MRPTHMLRGVMGLVVLAVALAMPAQASAQGNRACDGLVTVSLTNVRKGPGSSFPVVGTRPNGALVRLISREGTWWEIEPDQWMHQSVVEPVVWRRGTVVGTATLNVRVGPGTQHRIVRRLYRGDPVWVRETQGLWHRVANSEWVYASFVDLEP